MTDIFNILLTVVGISLLIFFHELGHFLAARWAGVRVEAFSLGFGPVIYGWKRGVTEYRLSLIPLGGYVKMAGELPHEGRTGAPDELTSKSIGTRAWIFSAGVIMNVLIALVLFPLVFLFGVNFQEPVIGSVLPGGAAWRAGLQPGSEILEVNGSEVLGYEHARSRVALGPAEETRLIVRNPAGDREEIVVKPVPGLRGLSDLQVSPIRDRQMRLAVMPGSAAAEAGLLDGDRLLQVNGQKVDPFHLDPISEAEIGGGPIELLVDHDGQEKTFRFERRPVETSRKILGIWPPLRRVVALRDHPSVTAAGLQEGDILKELDGRPILMVGDLGRILTPGKKQTLRLQRSGITVEAILNVSDEEGKKEFLSHIALGQDLQTTQVVPQPGMPASQAGIQAGDYLEKINGKAITDWTALTKEIRAAQGAPLKLHRTRRQGDGATSEVLTVSPGPELFYGFKIQEGIKVYREENLFRAVGLGFVRSMEMVQDIVLTLKKIFIKELSPENLGGIIEIGGTAFHVSREGGLTKLLFFLALLSINLAFLNILPIPVLDGGHLFFLLVEKIKGSPVSERVLGYSQMIGLALLLSLILFVTYNDVKRWFF